MRLFSQSCTQPICGVLEFVCIGRPSKRNLPNMIAITCKAFQPLLFNTCAMHHQHAVHYAPSARGTCGRCSRAPYINTTLLHIICRCNSNFLWLLPLPTTRLSMQATSRMHIVATTKRHNGTSRVVHQVHCTVISTDNTSCMWNVTCVRAHACMAVTGFASRDKTCIRIRLKPHFHEVL